jgi:capsular exopolysaccharide synthesis family protein
MKHLTPIYSSNILISVDNDKESRITSLFPNSNVVNIDMESQLNYDISILQSHTVILDVLKKVDLSQRFYIEGRWRDRELYNGKIPFNLKFKKSPKAKINSFKFIIEEIDNKHFKFNDNLNEKKNLNHSYRYGEKIKNKSYELTINKREKELSLFGEKYIIKIETNRENLISTVLQNLSIEKEIDRLLRISYEDPIPERAKDIATQLIISYEEYNLRNRQLKDVNNIKFFDKTIAEIESRLKEIRDKLGNYQSNHSELLILGSEDRFFFNIIEKNREIANISLKLNALEKTKERMSKGIYSISLLENNDLQVADLRQLMEQLRGKSDELTLLYQQQNDINSPLVRDLSYTDVLTKLNTAKKRLQELKIEYTSEYPEVRRTQENIHSLEEELKFYLKNNIDNYLIEIKELKGKITKIITLLINSIKKKYDSLQKSLKKDRVTMDKLPESSMKLEEFKRAFKLNENNHKRLLQKKSEAIISKASTMSNIHIINSASYSKSPIKPKRKFIYLSGLILGIILSIIYTSFRVSRDKTIYDEKDIKLKDYSLIYNNKTINADNFWTLITKLEIIRGSNKSKIVLISSNDYGENKSFTTIKLAWALTNISKRVLIIDFDFYHSQLSKQFSQTPDMGLSTLLTSKHFFDEIDITKYISHIQKEGKIIDLLPTGPLLPNGSELLFNAKNKFLLEELSKKYDYILIDTPPIGQYPETTILLKYVHIFLATAVVQKTNKSFFEKLQELEDESVKKIFFLTN